MRRLAALGGHSLRSVYSHYCREYSVPTKPQARPLPLLPAWLCGLALRGVTGPGPYSDSRSLAQTLALEVP